ncbi:CoA binding domain-containing protein [Mycena latifolia]|nr:CoA binding domain-containing protein [Mycena latifolia]
MRFLISASYLLLAASRLCVASPAVLLASKTEMFMSAPSFAVVGASNDETKFGTIVFKEMLEKGLDVAPINPFVPTSQGIPCLQSLADIADPARTSISVVTQPSVTLQILRQAHALGIFSIWLQPGAEDEAVLDFIANVTSAGSGTNYIHTAAPRHGVVRRNDTIPPCLRSLDTPDVISALRR